MDLGIFDHSLFLFQLKLVDEKSNEAEIARSALFSKHSEMMGNCLKITLVISHVNGCKFQSPPFSLIYTYWLLKTNSHFLNIV